MAQNVDFEIFVRDSGGIAKFRSLDSVLGQVDKSQQAATTSAGKLWTQFAAGIGVANLVTAAARKIVTTFTDGVTAAVDFEAAMANVSTLVDTSTGIMGEFEQGILGMAGELGSATDLTSGLYQALSAGVEPAKALEFVTDSAKFAKAALTDTHGAVDLLSTVLNAYGMNADEAGRVSDILFQTIKDGKTTGEELAGALGRVIPTAATMGVKLEYITGALATMTKGGISTDEAVTSLNATMMGIIKPSDDARKAAEDLKLEFSKAGVEGAGGFEQFLIKLKAAVGDNETTMARLFPNVRGLKAVFALTGAQAGEFSKIMNNMDDTLGNVDEAFEKQQQTAKATFEAIQNQLSAAFTQALLPALRSFSGWIKENKEAILSFFSLFSKAISLVISQITELRSGLLGLSTVNLSDIAGKIEGVNTGFVALNFTLGELENKWIESFTPMETVTYNMKPLQEATKKTAGEIKELKEILPPTRDEFLAFKGPLETFDEYFTRIHENVMPGVNLQLNNTTEAAESTGNEIDKTGKKGESLSDIFTSLSTTTESAFKAIEQLGIDLGALPAIMQSVMGGLTSIGSGINALSNMTKSFTSILSGVAGGFSLVTGAVSIVSGIIGALSGPSGELEAARRRMQGLQMNTEGWGEKIETLAEQLGGADSAGRAFNSLLADMIRDSDITVDNFDNYINKVREIVSTYEQGNATIEETQRNFGAAFDAIIQKAQELGIEGSWSITALIQLADEFGLSVQEINNYIQQNNTAALEGWKAAIVSFGDFSIPVLDEMLALQGKIADNQQLIDSINGANQAMMSLANTPDFLGSQFDTFQQIAVDAMNQLTAAGFSTAEAMESDAGLRGMLQNIINLSEQHGFTIDENTQKLIDEGIASGALSEASKSDSEIMQKGFDDLIERFDLMLQRMGVDIPEALEYMGNTAIGVGDRMNRNISATQSGYADIADTIYDEVIPAIGDMGAEHDNVMFGQSIIPDLEKWEDQNDLISNQLENNMVSAIGVMGDAFDKQIATMQDGATTLHDNMEDEIESLKAMYEALGLAAVAVGLESSKYTQYGVGAEEKDTEKFAELSALWGSNWQDIVNSEEGFQKFLEDLQGLDVIDEMEGPLQDLINWIQETQKNISEGKVWDPESQSFVEPPGFQHGGGFTVPPGYENDTFPARFSSGETVYVEPKGHSGATINNQGGDTYHLYVNVMASPTGDTPRSLIDKLYEGLKSGYGKEKIKRVGVQING